MLANAPRLFCVYIHQNADILYLNEEKKKKKHRLPVPTGGLLTAGVGAALGVGKVNSKINTIANVVNNKANLLNFKTNLVNTGINGASFVSSCE